MSKIRSLRMGTPPHKTIDLGNGENKITVKIVALPLDMTQDIEEQVEEYCQSNRGKVNDSVRQQMYNKLLAYYCMRDPDDPTMNTKLADSVEEVGEFLDLEDISRVVNAYSELIMNKAPKIELMSQEEFDELKKYLDVTPLSDLSTVSLVHLGNFRRSVVSEK